MSNFSKTIAEIKVVFPITIIYFEVGENSSPLSRWKLFILNILKDYTYWTNKLSYQWASF